MQALLSRKALFALAAREDVESRLITNFRRQWKMAQGPLQTLPSSSQKNWTLLVQGANLHDDAVDQLMHQFRFLPDARLDDLMISYATDQGGVGAHFDSYDVFLLQAHGQRRWRIGAQKDLSLKPDMPLKILREFIPQQEFVLEPGDMLYLPPHYAHEGVAIGECMTYSIGFRAPSWQELGEAFLNFMADSVALPGRYSDPELGPSAQPAKIGDSMISSVSRELNKLSSTPEDIAIFLGEYLSEPKASVIFDYPEKPMTAARFQAAALKRGLRLTRKSRLLYRNKYIFMNGESFQPGSSDKRLLQQLGDQRALAADRVAACSSDLNESLYQWYCDGWLELA